MWRNMKISTKLLLGFSLVLAVFAAAVLVTWNNLIDLQSNNHYMENAVVPGMRLTSQGEREIYELFLVVDTMKLSESEESVRDVDTAQAAVLKVLDDVAVTLRSYPDVRSLKYAKEKVGPLVDTYFQMLDATQKAIQKKNASFAALVAKGMDMADAGERLVNEIFDYSKAELRGGSLTEKQMEILAVVQKITGDLMNLRYTLLRQVASKNVSEIPSTAGKLLGNIENTLQTLRSTFSVPQFQNDATRLLDQLPVYRKLLETFIEDFNALQKIHADRGPIMASLGAECSTASEIGQDRVAEFAAVTQASLTSCVTLLFSAAGLSILLGLAIAFFLSRSITKPLSTIVDLAKRAGDGDLTIEKKDFNYEGRDELGILAEALSGMIGAQEETLEQVVSVAEELSGGANNLSAISEETNASMEEVKASVEQVSTLSESNGAALEECNAGVEEMSAGADTVAQSATDSAAFISQTT
ncbi:MAG: methyl-accepting chemotaxis protein, partial [Synergistaceae bacterium]|nr:methyl-accepting chemotaxis protein [Synergistaceae bacterium]